MTLRIVTRQEWGSVRTPPHLMPLPAREVWLHHSVTAVTADPVHDVRGIEAIGIQRFGHISYSYLVHPNGTVLEGAGLRVGAHTQGRNSTSFGVCWIGNYSQRQPTAEQKRATRELIARLIGAGHLRLGNYPTGGHRDLKATECPGNHAYAALAELRQGWVALTREEDEVALVDSMADQTIGGKAAWSLLEDGTIRNFYGARHLGEPKGKDYWGARRADHLEANDRGGYDVLSTDGGRYSYPTE